MRIAIALISLLLLYFSSVNAQVNKKYTETIKEADEYIQSNDYKEAIPLLLSLKNNNNSSANVEYKLGICYLHSPANIDLAISYFTRAIGGIHASYNENDEAEVNASPLVYLYLGDAYRLKNRFEAAIHAYDQYALLLSRDDIAGKIAVRKRINECHMAKVMIHRPIVATFKNAGELINHGVSNYAGCISGDGNTMVFVRSLKFYEAIFESKHTANGWSAPEEITSRLGSDGDFIPTGLNYNGSSMLLTAFSMLSGNDIYESKQEKAKWGKAQKLNFQVSSSYNDIDAVYSSDEKEIYFSSNREKGSGGYDLYKSTKDDSGNWSFVQNLDKPINTASDERSPSLTDDNRVLIYSSNGIGGMGGFDFYYNRKNNEGKYGTSYNVGYPINSTDDDLNYKAINKSGDALVSKFDPHGTGDIDLVFVHADNFSSFRKIPLKGQLSINGDHSWAKPLQLYFVDKTSGDTIQKEDILSGIYETSLYPGDFILTTSQNYNQAFTISADTSVHSYDLVSLISDSPANDVASNKTSGVDSIAVIKIGSEVIQPSDTLYVKDILFGFNDYQISQEEALKLNAILFRLTKYKGVTIRLSGYTDAVGLTAYNKKLAGQRALNVKKFLTDNGLTKSQIAVEAYGNINFVARNTNADGSDNPAGRALNRRVELKINVKAPGVIIIRKDSIAKSN